MEPNEKELQQTETEELFKVKAEYTKDSFWEAARLFRSGLFLGMRIFFLVLFLIALVFVGLNILSAINAENLSSYISSAGLSTVLSAFVLGFSLYKMITFERSMKKSFMTTLKRSLGVKDLMFFENYYHCTGENDDRTIQYNTLRSIIETADRLFILSSSSMDIIPKDAVEKGDYEQLMQLIDQKAPSTAKRRYLK